MSVVEVRRGVNSKRFGSNMPPMRTRVAAVSIAFLTAAAMLIGASNRAHAGEALRCGGKAIVQGTSDVVVRRFCGDPEGISYSSILRRVSFTRHGQSHYYYGNPEVELPVETWTYNFGPNKLMHRLRFVDGILEEIQALEYGYR